MRVEPLSGGDAPPRQVSSVRIDVPMRLREIPALGGLVPAGENPHVMLYAFITPVDQRDEWHMRVLHELVLAAGPPSWTRAEDDPCKWVGRPVMSSGLLARVFELVDQAPAAELERSKSLRRLRTLEPERRKAVSVVFFSHSSEDAGAGT